MLARTCGCDLLGAGLDPSCLASVPFPVCHPQPGRLGAKNKRNAGDNRVPKYIPSLISTRRLPGSHVRLPANPAERHGAPPRASREPGTEHPRRLYRRSGEAAGDGPAWEGDPAQGLNQSEEGQG